MPELEIYLGGVLLDRGLWTHERNLGTGFITALPGAGNGLLSAKGGFYIKMLAPNGFPTTSVGGGMYQLKQGTSLIEPWGGD